MSPVEMNAGEVRYYSSPVMVKTQQYTGTLTSERLIIEGGSAPREFKMTNIASAGTVTLPSGEPGLRLMLSTPNGQKEMIWSFPGGDIFKAGEQQAWVDHIQKAIGTKQFAVPSSQPAPMRAAPAASAAMPQSPVYSPWEMEIMQTAGVRIKRTYYTLYLTNLRLILQNTTGQICREFSIAELMDAARMESESGEPSVALTIGSQTGVKQMILTFPSPGSREAWMVQLSAKLPAQHVVPQMSAPQLQMLTLQPGEKTYMSSPGIRVKHEAFTAYLTNTRFVLMGNKNGMMVISGEFSLSTLKNAIRIAGELGEPGVDLTLASRDGEKVMHLLFPSMDLREMWISKFEEVIPPELPPVYGGPAVTSQYSVSTVAPPVRGNAPSKFCTVCGARNHPDDRFCALCGKPLGEIGGAGSASAAASMTEPSVPDMFGGRADPPRERPKKGKAPKRERSQREAIGTFLLSGVVWAVVSVLMLTYLLPMILPITAAEFPILGALKSDMMAMVVLIVMMLVLWIVFVMLWGGISGVLAKIFREDAGIGEVLAVVMRSVLPFAVVGWIPGFGVLLAAVWSLVAMIKGFGASLEMRGGAAAGCAVVGMALVAVILIALGII